MFILLSRPTEIINDPILIRFDSSKSQTRPWRHPTAATKAGSLWAIVAANCLQSTTLNAQKSWKSWKPFFRACSNKTNVSAAFGRRLSQAEFWASQKFQNKDFFCHVFQHLNGVDHAEGCTENSLREIASQWRLRITAGRTRMNVKNPWLFRLQWPKFKALGNRH